MDLNHQTDTFVSKTLNIFVQLPVKSMKKGITTSILSSEEAFRSRIGDFQYLVLSIKNTIFRNLGKETVEQMDLFDIATMIAYIVSHSFNTPQEMASFMGNFEYRPSDAASAGYRFLFSSMDSESDYAMIASIIVHRTLEAMGLLNR